MYFQPELVCDANAMRAAAPFVTDSATAAMAFAHELPTRPFGRHRSAVATIAACNLLMHTRF
jgi:hypothetical protein